MSSSEFPRAPRYTLALRLSYRRGGHVAWRTGRAENVSSSGLLFVPDTDGHLPDPGSAIELDVSLPANRPGANGARVLAVARVVRIAQAAGGRRPGLAVTFTCYRFLPVHGGGDRCT